MYDLPLLIDESINNEFKFQDSVCSGCHDLTMLSVNICNIAVITVKNVDYSISFYYS